MGIFDEIGDIFGSSRGRREVRDTFKFAREEIGIRIGKGSAQSREDSMDSGNELRAARNRAALRKLEGDDEEIGRSSIRRRGQRSADDFQPSVGGGRHSSGSVDGSIDDNEMTAGWSRLSKNDRIKLVQGLETLTGKQIERNGRVDANALEGAINQYIQEGGNLPQGVEQGNRYAWKRFASQVASEARNAPAPQPRQDTIGISPMPTAPTTPAPSQETLPAASPELLSKLDILFTEKKAVLKSEGKDVNAYFNQMTQDLGTVGHPVQPPRGTDEFAAYLQKKNPDLADSIAKGTDKQQGVALLDQAIGGLRADAAAKSPQASVGAAPAAQAGTPKNANEAELARIQREKEDIIRFLTEKQPAAATAKAAVESRIDQKKLDESLLKSDPSITKKIDDWKKDLGIERQEGDKTTRDDSITSDFSGRGVQLIIKYGSKEMRDRVAAGEPITKEQLEDAIQARKDAFKAGEGLKGNVKVAENASPASKPVAYHDFDFIGAKRSETASPQTSTDDLNGSIGNVKRVLEGIRIAEDQYAKSGVKSAFLQDPNVIKFRAAYEAETGTKIWNGVAAPAQAQGAGAGKDAAVAPASEGKDAPKAGTTETAKAFAAAMKDWQKDPEKMKEISEHLAKLGIKTDPKKPETVMNNFAQWAAIHQPGVTKNIGNNPDGEAAKRDIPRLLDVLENHAKNLPAKAKDETKVGAKDDAKTPAKDDAKSPAAAPTALTAEQQGLVSELKASVTKVTEFMKSPFIPQNEKDKLPKALQESTAYLNTLGIKTTPENVVENLSAWAAKQDPENVKKIIAIVKSENYLDLGDPMKKLFGDLKQQAVQAQAKGVSTGNVRTAEAGANPPVPLAKPKGEEKALW